MNTSIVFDTCVLLTGMFAPQSKSRQLLEKVKHKDMTGYVAENTIEEAKGAIERAHKNTGVDLSRSLDAAIIAANLKVLPRIHEDEAKLFSDVKGRGDKAVAAAAKKMGAIVCSNDLKDFSKLSNYGIRFATPDELVSNGGIGLNTIFPAFLATQEQGTFFVEVSMLHWVGVKFPPTANERMYFFDAEGICCCYFNASSSSIVAELSNGPNIAVKVDIITHDLLPLKIVVTYDNRKEAALRVGYRGKKEVSQTTWTCLKLPINARTWIGSNKKGTQQLCGAIRHLYAIPCLVNETETNNIMNNLTVHQPWERLSLEQIIEWQFKDIAPSVS